MSRLDVNLLFIGGTLLLTGIALLQPFPVSMEIWRSMTVRILCMVGQGVIVGIYIGWFIWKR